jgi:hypothetical protein
MEELGFQEIGRHFEHPDSEFFVEFPPGPPSLGRENIIRIDELVMETGILRLILPTDCMKDRLAWYYHDGDRQCLSQAILVSNEHQIDIREIRNWSVGEGKLDEFVKIKHSLRGR